MKNSLLACVIVVFASACIFSVRADVSERFRDSVDITVAARAGAMETLTNFPVLVRISEARMRGFLYSRVGAGGLIFVDSAGEHLPHEIDMWNTSGESLVWVRLSTLPPAGTTIKMCWNLKEGQTPPENVPTDVWSGSYVGVWHMAEASGDVADATGHGLTAVAKGKMASQMVASDGVVGNARINAVTNNLYGTKTGYLSIASYDSFGLQGVFTFSGWYLATSTNGYQRLVSRRDSLSVENGWEIEMQNGAVKRATARGSNTDSLPIFLPDITADWLLLTMVYNGDSLSVYTNGVLSRSGTIVPALDNGKPLSIGSNSSGAERSFYGKYDECRLGIGAFSAERVKADYETVARESFAAPSSSVFHDGVPVTATQTTPIPVPYSELESRFASYLERANGDYEAAAKMKGLNGCTIWQSYLAGLAPDDEGSRFLARIAIVDGKPVITWEPDTAELRRTRVYRKLGRNRVDDPNEQWSLVEDGAEGEYRFFKVSVELPQSPSMPNRMR